MTNLSLEPYSAVIEWQFQEPLSVTDWQRILSSFLENLAQESSRLDNTVIGHIKGFASFGEDGVLQISVVSAERPATVTTQENLGEEYQHISLTINFLVYGLPFQRARKIVEHSDYVLAKSEQGSITFARISDPSQASHHHE